jgi:hypothetical protein
MSREVRVKEDYLKRLIELQERFECSFRSKLFPRESTAQDIRRTKTHHGSGRLRRD